MEEKKQGSGLSKSTSTGNGTHPARAAGGSDASILPADVRVLVIDIGGSHVKMAATGAASSRRFDSHERLTPGDLVREVHRQARGWRYEVVAIGYPGRVHAQGPAAEPANLGVGWVGFDFEQAFGVPVRIVNDAVMQALGGYDGGRMLYLGLGTGLGSALVTEHVAIPLELSALRYRAGQTIGERLGRQGLVRYGKRSWRRAVTEIAAMLHQAVSADYVLLGGGNAEHVKPIPAFARRGGNEDAIAGGFRLWEEPIEPHDRSPAPVWRVVR